ncbi:alpha/beta fold hydrolase [Shewanella sp. SG41-4]|uniref:alpha/beta fold hydrolase n=1 Tax=Shewanella sp. SG41-4 TaxID=2760976 RepID=UPI002175C9E9|nr:alpha/beta hydrolase [Shewanella sp. SG41-4]
MKLEHKNILVDKVNIHYVESGQSAYVTNAIKAKDISTVTGITAAKPTMIFLHGFPEYWGTWSAQLSFFSENYRVIAPDLPGYNLSDKPADVRFYTVPNLIAFIAKFIAAISPDRPVILVAHDWGGAIAWPLAAFHAQLISQLIIVNAAHPSTFTREMINNPLQRKKSAYIHQLISASGESLLIKDDYRYLSEDIMVSTNPSVFTADVKAQYKQVWSQTGAINGMLQYYRAMPQLAKNDTDNQSNNSTASFDTSSIQNDAVKSTPVKDTSQLKIPNIRVNVATLILWGEQDLAFVNENLDDIHHYVPNCVIKRFKDTSHWLQHERPNEVNAAINAFINV